MADNPTQQDARSIQRARRACDGCRLRRVKCNGDPDRCQQCNHLNLRCVYTTNKPKSSRRGVARGSVISRIKTRPTSSPGTNTPNDNRHGHNPESSTDAGPTSPYRLQTEFSKDFFMALIEDYRLHVYPVNPIIAPSEILESIDRMDGSDALVDNALVHAYAAVTINLTSPNWQADDAKSTCIHRLLGLALAARNAVMIQSLTSVKSSLHPHLSAPLIMTAIFLEICLMAVGKYQEAFMMLREAISMVQLLRVDLLVADEPNPHISSSERTRRIRMYWEAFIHERFLTIVAYYPPILSPLPTEVLLPREDPSIASNIHTGWQYLTGLFSVLDDDFVRFWINANKPAPEAVTSEWIESKMHYLNHLYDVDLELQHDSYEQQSSPATVMSPWDYTHQSRAESDCLTTLQKADIIITRQWLLMLLWQLAVSNFLLTSEDTSSEANTMSLQFPVRLSQQLRHVVVSLGRPSIERHGSGMLKKLFEITNALADVVVHVPTDSNDEAAQRMDDFNFLFEFLRTSASLSEVQVSMLVEKNVALNARIG